MSHLGRWLSALVDGELDGTERDRVLNHVAGCETCRQEANAMRALKRRLTALGNSSGEPAIAGRLIDLARSDHSSSDPVGGEPRPPEPRSGSLLARPAYAARPSLKIAAGSAGSALAAIGLIAFLLGNGGAMPAPKVTPSVDSYLMQHAYDAGQAPAGYQPGIGTAPAYHGSRLAGPALPRPQQFSPPTSVYAVPVGPGAGSPQPLPTAAASPAAVGSGSASPAAGRSPG